MQTGSAARQTMPDVIQSGRMIVSIVRAAELANHPDYAGLTPELLVNLRQCDRIVRKLYQQLTEAFGEPPRSSPGNEAFLTLDAERLKEVAISVGLAFHLPSFGEALDRKQLEAIVNAFGQPIVFRALSYTAMVPGRRVVLGTFEDCLAMVEPDGWMLLRQWAEHAGIDPRWRILPQFTQSASLRRDVTVLAAPLVGRALVDFTEEAGQS